MVLLLVLLLATAVVPGRAPTPACLPLLPQPPVPVPQWRPALRRSHQRTVPVAAGRCAALLPAPAAPAAQTAPAAAAGLAPLAPVLPPQSLQSRPLHPRLPLLSPLLALPPQMPPPQTAPSRRCVAMQRGGQLHSAGESHTLLTGAPRPPAAPLPQPPRAPGCRPPLAPRRAGTNGSDRAQARPPPSCAGWVCARASRAVTPLLLSLGCPALAMQVWVAVRLLPLLLVLVAAAAAQLLGQPASQHQLPQSLQIRPQNQCCPRLLALLALHSWPRGRWRVPWLQQGHAAAACCRRAAGAAGAAPSRGTRHQAAAHHSSVGALTGRWRSPAPKMGGKGFSGALQCKVASAAGGGRRRQAAAAHRGLNPGTGSTVQIFDGSLADLPPLRLPLGWGLSAAASKASPLLFGSAGEHVQGQRGTGSWLRGRRLLRRRPARSRCPLPLLVCSHLRPSWCASAPDA